MRFDRKIYDEILEICKKESKFELPEGIKHILGFDTEYQGEETLCLQFYHYQKIKAVVYVNEGVVTPPGPVDTMYVRVKNMNRVRFSEIMEDVYIHYGIEKGERVILGAHSGTNDLARFEDFFTPTIWGESVRLIKNKILGKIKTKDGKDIYLFDTCHFFPVSLHSASEKSKFGQKDSLSSEEIKDIKRLIKMEPEKFFEYAVQDARVTSDLCYEILRGIVVVGRFTEQNLFSMTPSSVLSKAFTQEKIVTPAENIDYKGGHTEAFYYGQYDGVVYDYDIIACYNTIVACMPVWHHTPVKVKDVEELYNLVMSDNLVAGSVTVRYRFKEGNVPTIPYKIRNGLTYPVSGETKISPQEFFVAYKYLEVCEIVDSVLYRSRSLATSRALIMRAIISIRAGVKRMNPTLEKVLKIIANAGYGVHAQGLGGKTSLTLVPEGEKLVKRREKVPKTGATNLLAASFITAMARAVIAEYIHYCREKGVEMFLVATDGFSVNKELEKEACFGVGVYGRLLSKVRTDIMGVFSNVEQRIEILECSKHLDLNLINSRRYMFGDAANDRAKFSGYSNATKQFIEDKVMESIKEGRRIRVSVNRLQSPVNVYDPNKKRQKKVMYKETETSFTVLPMLGRNEWQQIDQDKSKNDIVPYRAVASPLDTDKTAQRYDNFKRTVVGKRIEQIGNTEKTERIEARNYMFSITLSKVDLAKLLYEMFPNTTKTDLCRFFKLGKNALAGKTDGIIKAGLTQEEFLRNLLLILDCYTEVKYESVRYRRKAKQLTRILKK